ncbi:helix-turn-helix domain-containing protein [Enterococcus plantarum]|uniref:HTH cro/C1-type domain-containing protein n=1 Tax=Enterococcus plantarum TaxID=1077675 RepID=A0A2W3ZTB5_9ENTE|nr:Rgg/GadR/MutR family transcriptional regulator [Enterococcus plantarum]MBO0467832.1 helix-turn-helix domain-containing protein [Enterococcus plantarum]PZL72123.1 hypothetical protein CI088_10950 [Enterococcus plantarum]
MIIDLGQTIDFIRKGKNISIKILTTGVISRSQYHRIINNQSEISAVTFFKLLEQLNVSIEEFMYIGNSFKEDEFKRLFKNVKRAFLEKNIEKLEELKLYSLNLHKKSLIEKYKHIYLVIDLLINRLNLNNDYSKQNEIQYYLLNLNFFTHYDLVLYINTYFSFSRETNELMITNIFNSANKYKNLKQYESELVKILINMIIIEIEEKDILKVHKYTQILVNLNISDELLLEQVLQNFFIGLSLIITEDCPNGILITKRNIDFLKQLNNSYWRVLENIYAVTITVINKK